MAAGYSGTPLAKKLAIAPGHTVLLVEAPDGVEDWLAPLPQGAGVVRTDWAGVATASADVVIAFSSSRTALRDAWPACTTAAGPTGAVWVAWPKRASKVPTDITEDTLRTDLLPSGWVDVKVCAVSDVWSGLRFVLRKELRP